MAAMATRILQFVLPAALLFRAHAVRSLQRDAHARAGGNSVNSTDASLPHDTIMLSGGTPGYILKTLCGGIATSGEASRMKLGPGFYNTVFSSRPDNWTKDAFEASWRGHIWRANFNMRNSMEELPFVFISRFPDAEARFGLMPRTLWYGDMSTWKSNPAKQACLKDFDVLFIPHVYDSDLPNDQGCHDLHRRMEDRSLKSCQAIDQEEVARLAARRCIQEMKVNAGSEVSLRVEAIAQHVPGKTAMELDGGVELGTASNKEVNAVRSWLGHRIAYD
eukprot:TRINITY_DN15866_c0_g1_i2.p1 TRINITY_DN15866_c0_g1~~TRINITY_DN15866_c0_g1_i2.p1  ORF type:complete len:277 (-),score=31.72 TRINITY_DN15866_c0_g1_i2:907-1737(-)